MTLSLQTYLDTNCKSPWLQITLSLHFSLYQKSTDHVLSFFCKYYFCFLSQVWSQEVLPFHVDLHFVSHLLMLLYHILPGTQSCCPWFSEPWPDLRTPGHGSGLFLLPHTLSPCRLVSPLSFCHRPGGTCTSAPPPLSCPSMPNSLEACPAPKYCFWG